MNLELLNIIPSVMSPYTYAIGAILAAIASPFILKFILKAPETNCFEHDNANEDSIKVNTNQTRRESKFMFLQLFIVLTISSAIAFHAHLSWSQAFIALISTWVIIAEIVLEIRIQVISSWLPIIAIWLGLIFNADPSNTSNLPPIDYITAPLIIWSIISIIKNLCKNYSISNILSPTCLSIPGAWLGLYTASSTILFAFIAVNVLNVLELLTFIILRKIKPNFSLKPIISNKPFNSILLSIIWLIIIN